MSGRMLSAALAALVLSTASCSSAAQTTVTSADGSIAVLVGSAGIGQIQHRGGRFGIRQSGAGLTNLSRPGSLGSPDRCAAGAPGVVQASAGGAVVQTLWHCQTSGGPVSVVVRDSFLSGRASIVINTTIGTAGRTSPFSVNLHTGLPSLVPPDSPRPVIWLPWGKGCVQNDGKASTPWCLAGNAAWREPLSPEPWPASSDTYRYGTELSGFKDTFSVPIVSQIHADAAISLALAPSDPLLEVGLQVNGDGGLGFDRQLLRLGSRSVVSFSAHLVAHGPCWRPGLQFMIEEFGEYFKPWAADAAEFEGLGSYSWNQQAYNASYARSVGFKTNWDLSGTFMPYDGLFLPYTDRWLNLGPINAGLNQYNVTFEMINAYYKQIQQAGFHSLSYFDIGNWGTRTDTNYTGPARYCGQRPSGDPAPCPDPNGANSYLRDKLSPALLRHGWSVSGGKFMQHKMDWVGTTDMDTIEPVFEDLIVEQLERHQLKLPDTFEGIAIDRLDYSEFFNYDRDDGISWVPINASNASRPAELDVWGPARALRLSYRHTFDRLHQVLHPAGGKGKMMLNNCNTVCRLDEMRAFDGTFSEGATLNAVAWTGLACPTILWTYGLAPELDSVLDPYFQQHLLMNVSNRSMCSRAEPCGRCIRWPRCPRTIIASNRAIPWSMAPTWITAVCLTQCTVHGGCSLSVRWL